MHTQMPVSEMHSDGIGKVRIFRKTRVKLGFYPEKLKNICNAKLKFPMDYAYSIGKARIFSKTRVKLGFYPEKQKNVTAG